MNFNDAVVEDFQQTTCLPPVQQARDVAPRRMARAIPELQVRRSASRRVGRRGDSYQRAETRVRNDLVITWRPGEEAIRWKLSLFFKGSRRVELPSRPTRRVVRNPISPGREGGRKGRVWETDER